MKALAALGLAFALSAAAPEAAPGATPAPSASLTPPPARLLVRGQVLSLGGGYLVFTTGQAVRVARGVAVPARVPVGIFVRATLDTAAGAVVALEFRPKGELAGEIDAAHVARSYLASSVASLPSVPPESGPGPGPLSRLATVTIRVSVPNNTPQLDDVYVATDRSQFGAAEVRMQRLDLHRWVVQISLPSGTTLRYEFTRGFNTTIERDRSGGIVTPRAATVTDGLATDDTVQRWSDIQ